jgi:outer membrane protein TolC
MIRFADHRVRWSSLLLAAWASITAQAETGGLSLADVQRRAVDHQPVLMAAAAQVAAARERAIAARELPDPELKLAIQNLPVDTADAWRFNRESMTQSMAGLSQTITLPGKRRLSSETESLAADERQAELGAMTRAVQRDAGLAFLDLVHPHHAAVLAQQQIQQATAARDAAQIAYRNGSRRQADVLAAQAAIGLLEDKAAEYAQAYAAAQENLRRWTGELPDAEPEEPATIDVPPLPELIAQLSRHPEWIAAERAVDRAGAAERLARKLKQPDVNVEIDYGYRTDYSDMVSLQVGIPLPLFTHNRQDRAIAAAREAVDAAQADRDDLQRRLVAEISATFRQWQALGVRIDRYERTVIPPLSQGIEASLADYRSGSGSFTAVIAARQALFDAQLSLLELRLQRLREALKLRYFAPDASHA